MEGFILSVSGVIHRMHFYMAMKQKATNLPGHKVFHIGRRLQGKYLPVVPTAMLRNLKAMSFQLNTTYWDFYL